MVSPSPLVTEFWELPWPWLAAVIWNGSQVPSSELEPGLVLDPDLTPKRTRVLSHPCPQPSTPQAWTQTSLSASVGAWAGLSGLGL